MWKKIRNNTVFRVILILLFLAVCGGVGSSIAYIRYESNPTEEAMIYFRAFMNKDYDAMYKCIDIDDEMYINKEMYKSKMKEAREKMAIDSYEFSEPYDKNGTTMVDVACEDVSTNKSVDFNISFNTIRGFMQIIPDYKVNIDHMLVDNLTVIVPKGDVLTINGEKISSKMSGIVEEEEKDKTTYKINKIINGKYKFAATNQYCASASNNEINKPDTKIELLAKNYTANAANEALIVKNAEGMIKEFYNAVRERKEKSKSLLKYFENDSKLIKKVKKLVQQSEEVVYWPDQKNADKYKVISMEMGKLAYSSKFNEKNKTYSVIYDFSYKYVSSTDTALYESYTYRISGSCNTKMTLTYTIKDDGLSLTDISIKNKNKKAEVK